MVIVKVDLPEEIDKIFKEKVIERFGFKRGAITEAMLEAIKNWINMDVTSDNEPELEDFIVPDEYSNKYIAVHNNQIEVIADTLGELWDKLPEKPEMKYTLYTPHMNQSKERKLGWLGTFKR